MIPRVSGKRNSCSCGSVQCPVTECILVTEPIPGAEYP